MPARVVIFGLGTLGSGVVRILAERDAYEIVAAVCRREENDGMDVGDIAGIGPIGIFASKDEDAVLSDVEADIVVHATRPLLATVEGELAKILGAGLNVVTLTEEAAYPWNSHPDEAGRLDALAKSHDVSGAWQAGSTRDSSGTPWWGTFSLGSRSISEIKIRRQTTLSFLSKQTLAQMGIGLTAANFDAAVASGEVLGHVGTRQSLELVGASFGWELESFEESLTGVEGQTYRLVASRFQQNAEVVDPRWLNRGRSPATRGARGDFRRDRARRAPRIGGSASRRRWSRCRPRARSRSTSCPP